jgi:cytidylate kinase
MTAITISKELGSEGTRIGQQAAERLGYQLVDEHTVEGVLRQYGLTKFSDLYHTTPKLWDLTNLTNLLIVSMLNETFQALAKRGNVVILGRGGFAALSGYKDVLKVRVQAPLSVRTQRVMAREKLADAQAVENRVKEDDKMRSNFVQLFYNKRWELEAHYDLVLDTEAISAEMAIDWTVEAVNGLAQKVLKDEETTQSIEVDSVLLDAIEKVMAHPLPPLQG